MAEADRERGPADPEDDAHGGSAEDEDQPAIFKYLDKETAAEVKRVLKQAE